MGLNNNNSAIYLTISNGKICRQLQAKSQTSVERVNKVGKLVHEEFYDNVSGVIVDINTKERGIGGQQKKFWEIKIADNGEVYNLEFDYSSGYAGGFLKAIPNANLSIPVMLIPKLSEVDGKKKTTLFLNQNGSALKHYFTKANPNGLPPMVLTKLKGKDVWDDYHMMEFLEKMIVEKIKPQLKGNTSLHVENDTTASGVTSDSLENGDMPF